MSGSLRLEMNERQSDFALLREFARDGRQPAFATLARRHLDLVYATALRKVDDSGGAEEIAQNVFPRWRARPGNLRRMIPSPHGCTSRRCSNPKPGCAANCVTVAANKLPPN